MWIRVRYDISTRVQTQYNTNSWLCNAGKRQNNAILAVVLLLLNFSFGVLCVDKSYSLHF